MSGFEVFQSPQCDETIYTVTHATGLTICVCPKPLRNACYAVIGTKYGSIDNNFSVNGGDVISVPAGIAHYLEHKLFESEDRGAMERFALTGAYANASTSYEKTSYEFSCPRNFYESLEILLDFVQKPYFTEENVLKERGIIEQEITGRYDRPGWWASTNLKKAMFGDHPVTVEIGGTLESIAQITPELLYTCYNTFYTPGNMVLSVCGNVDPDKVLIVCDRMMIPRETPEIVRSLPDDDGMVKQTYVEKEFDVPIPVFHLGFRKKYHKMNDRESLLSGLVMDSVFGYMTDFYYNMMKNELINGSFDYNGFTVTGARAVIFSGQSRTPEKVRDEIFREIERVRRDGISPELFECARRRSYGSMIYSFNSVYSVGDDMLIDRMFGYNTFAGLRLASEVTLDEANALFREQYDISNTALSVVRRGKEE